MTEHHQGDPDEWLKRYFEFEWCTECGRDHRHHTVNLDPLGNYFAHCDLAPVLDTNGVVINPEGLNPDA